MSANPSSDLNASSAGRVLIADTESLMCELLQVRLENEGFRVVIVSKGADVMKFDISEFSIVLVDLMGEPVDGLQVTAAI